MVSSQKALRALVSLCLLMAACSGGGSSAGNMPVPSAPTSDPYTNLPPNETGVPLVAKVNGVEITLPEFERVLLRRQREINAADPYALRAAILDTMIEQVLIEQAAAEQQVIVDSATLETEMQANIALAGSQAAWQQWLADNLYSEAEFRDTLRESLITLEMRDRVNQNLQGSVLQAHARHILVRTLDEAQAGMGRLQSGEDFSDLAATLSRDDTTRERGGDLGWFTEQELVTPELAEVAFALEPGQIAGPVPTSLGYHIVQTLEVAQRPVAVERRAYLGQIQFENWLRALRDRATIERYL